MSLIKLKTNLNFKLTAFCFIVFCFSIFFGFLGRPVFANPSLRSKTEIQLGSECKRHFNPVQKNRVVALLHRNTDASISYPAPARSSGSNFTLASSFVSPKKNVNSSRALSTIIARSYNKDNKDNNENQTRFLGYLEPKVNWQTESLTTSVNALRWSEIGEFLKILQQETNLKLLNPSFIKLEQAKNELSMLKEFKDQSFLRNEEREFTDEQLEPFIKKYKLHSNQTSVEKVKNYLNQEVKKHEKALNTKLSSKQQQLKTDFEHIFSNIDSALNLDQTRLTTERGSVNIAQAGLFELRNSTEQRYAISPIIAVLSKNVERLYKGIGKEIQFCQKEKRRYFWLSSLYREYNERELKAIKEKEECGKLLREIRSAVQVNQELTQIVVNRLNALTKTDKILNDWDGETNSTVTSDYVNEQIYTKFHPGTVSKIQGKFCIFVEEVLKFKLKPYIDPANSWFRENLGELLDPEFLRSEVDEYIKACFLPD